MNPANLPHIRNITVSGRIGCGATTLSRQLAEELQWSLLNGGDLFRAYTKDHGYAEKRTDDFDLAYDEKIKTIFRNETHHIVESQLAGFDAQGIPGVFKILTICEDEAGNDRPDVRATRVENRHGMPLDQAVREVNERERQNMDMWRRLYGGNDQNWIYWDKKYYDFVINTYVNDIEKTFQLAMQALGLTK